MLYSHLTKTFIVLLTVIGLGSPAGAADQLRGFANQVCRRIFDAHLPERDAVGELTIAFVNATEREVLSKYFNWAKNDPGNANITLGLARGHLLKLGEEDTIPGREGLLAHEQQVLDRFFRAGGEIFLWLEHSPHKDGAVGFNSEGRPHITLIEGITAKFLAHELNHYEHLLKIQEFLEVSGSPALNARLEAEVLQRTVTGTRVSESLAIATEARTAIAQGNKVSLLEGHPSHFIEWNTYPETAQLVSALWTRDQLKKLKWLHTKERRSKRHELLNLLEPLIDDMIHDIVVAAKDYRATVRRELKAAMPRTTRSATDRAKADFLKKELKILEAPLVALILGRDLDQPAYEGYGYEIGRRIYAETEE